MPMLRVSDPQGELVSRYRAAVRAYRGILARHPDILTACDERSYCDFYVRELPAFYWTGATASGLALDPDEAYRTAVREEA